MNPALRIVVRGNPAPQGSKRHVGNGVLIESSKNVKPWREAIRWAVIVAAAMRGLEQLRDLAEGCPACMLAAIRRVPLYGPGYCGDQDAISKWQFKDAMEALWEEVNNVKEESRHY